MKQVDVFGQKLQLSPNPMTAIYGYAKGVARIDDDVARPRPAFDGPECGNCIFFRRGRKSYHKCERRGITAGAGTDHRVHWPACGLYTERDDLRPPQ